MPQINNTRQLYLKNMHYMFLPCAMAIALFQIINNVREVDFFGATHWVWDYSLGFVKRGLVGQISEYIFGKQANTYNFISKASMALMATAIFSYLIFSYNLIKNRPKILSVVVSFSGLLLYPAIPSLIYDNGRFDQINYVLLMLACYIIMRSGILAGLIAYEACCCICIVIHEGFFFQQFPLLTVIFLSASAAKRHLNLRAMVWLIGPLILLPLLTFTAVWLWGSAPVSQAAWVDHWAGQATFIQAQPEDGSAMFVHFRTVGDNIYYTLREIRNPKILFAALVVAAIAYLSYFISKFFINNAPVFIKFSVILAAFSPCVMFIVGLDYLRWTSSLAFNTTIAISCLIYIDKFYENPADVRDPLMKTAPRMPGIFSIISASVLYIFLLFPQSTGVVGVRPLPEGFRCALGIAKIKETWPKNPDLCFWSQANDAEH